MTPISADPYFYYRDQTPYTESYMLSIQRQITPSALLTISFAGNQGHHLLVLVPTNPGNAALCLSLPGCGPFGEGKPIRPGPAQFLWEHATCREIWVRITAR